MKMNYRVEWLNSIGMWETDTTFDTLDKAIQYARKEYKRLRRIRYIQSTLHHRVMPESYAGQTKYGPLYTTEGDKTL